MHKIDLTKLDLNLLVVFDMLMRERSVSRAADRLGLTQPAISHALARLRAQIGDPLLVRMGGRMEPTPFAISLDENMRPHLAGLARALESKETFDPATSRRVFRVVLPDFAIHWVADLLQRISSEAPHVEIQWSVPTNASLLAVAEGQIDLALMPHKIRKIEGVSSHPICELPWACYMRRGHPALARWDRAAWSAWPHVQVSVCDATRNPVAEAAATCNIDRRIGASVPSFGLVAPLLEKTDLIATMPTLALERTCEAYSLQRVDCPLPIPSMAMALFWSTRLGEDESGQWLRQIFEAAITSEQDSPRSGTRLRMATV